MVNLVKFTKEDGSPVAINPEEISYIGPRRLADEKGEVVKVVMANGATHKVRAKYDDVVREIEAVKGNAQA